MSSVMPIVAPVMPVAPVLAPLPMTVYAQPLPAPLPAYLQPLPGSSVQPQGGLWNKIVNFLNRCRGRSYTPTVYGLTHDGNGATDSFVMRTIDEFRRHGARSIGVEATPHYLASDFEANIFMKAARYAQKNGMQIVPLQNNSTGRIRGIFGNGFHLIGDDGKFGRERLQRRILRAEMLAPQLSRSQRAYLAPEDARSRQRWREIADDLNELREILRSMNYAVPPFMSGWAYWNVTVFERELRQILTTARPALAFLGGAHLFGLAGIDGYNIVDATAVGPVALPSYEGHPNLRRFFYETSERFTIACLLIMQASLLQAVRKFTQVEAGSNELNDILEAAMMVEPDLPFLVDRANGYHTRFQRGLEFAQVSVQEANRRSDAAILRAIAFLNRERNASAQSS